ncbi:hypothetical protein LTSEHVI_1613, partial [Salmonella enterica subsp. enterica serovar Hvittingfoss str. A4-620]
YLHIKINPYFGPVFLSLLEKMCVFQKQAGFLALTVGIL